MFGNFKKLFYTNTKLNASCSHQNLRAEDVWGSEAHFDEKPSPGGAHPAVCPLEGRWGKKDKLETTYHPKVYALCIKET